MSIEDKRELLPSVEEIREMIRVENEQGISFEEQEERRLFGWVRKEVEDIEFWFKLNKDEFGE